MIATAHFQEGRPNPSGQRVVNIYIFLSSGEYRRSGRLAAMVGVSIKWRFGVVAAKYCHIC